VARDATLSRLAPGFLFFDRSLVWCTPNRSPDSSGHQAARPASATSSSPQYRNVCAQRPTGPLYPPLSARREQEAHATYFEYVQKSRLPIAVMTLSPQTLASVNSERARCFRPGLRMARRQRRRETADRRLQDRVGWWPSARCGASTLPPLPPLAAAVEACAPGSYLVASDPCGVLHRKQALGSMMQSLVVLLELSTRIGALSAHRPPHGCPAAHLARAKTGKFAET
jgi:hypothetical protein